jgi:hypothetical protein
MAVHPFHGSTIVAFMDIAGFKSMMEDGRRAPTALDAFYSIGFSVLDPNNSTDGLVEGFFISDCGVLFVQGQTTPLSRLESLCRVIQQIHRRTFEQAVQLTTSIAWGDFDYEERIQFAGITKSLIYGNAYMDAFADNEKGSPKLYPSECRLRRKGLPKEVDEFCTLKEGTIARWMRETPNHFYYEWMRRGQSNHPQS